MNYIRAILVFLLASCFLYIGYNLRSRAYIKTERLDDARIRVTCTNGGDPTVEAKMKPDEYTTIIVSCGTR